MPEHSRFRGYSGEHGKGLKSGQMRPSEKFIRSVLGLQLRKELVIIGVRSDPVPDYRVSVEHSHGSIADAHARRVDRRVRMDLLET